jgi:hypothetical protein
VEVCGSSPHGPTIPAAFLVELIEPSGAFSSDAWNMKPSTGS